MIFTAPRIPKPYYLIVVLMLMLCFGKSQAQSIFNKRISISVEETPLADVL